MKAVRGGRREGKMLRREGEAREARHLSRKTARRNKQGVKKRLGVWGPGATKNGKNFEKKSH